MNRDFEVRFASDDAEERTVTGIAIPWNETIDIGGFEERFERGSITAQEDIKLFSEHRDPIGIVTRSVDSDTGFLVEAKISDTPKGNEVRTLLKDGVLNKFSVGFKPLEERNDNGITVRTKVDMKEVSVVAFPAYTNADVIDVRNNEERNENNIMDKNETEVVDHAPEIRTLSEGLETLERKIDNFQTSEAPKEDELAFRSYGEYIQAYAKGDEAATGLLERVYTGGTTDDAIVKDSWVGDIVEVITKPRRVLNAFGTQTLPAQGLNVEYGLLDTDTTQVGVQAAEGDDLVEGKVSLTTATAPVQTVGGFGELSLQEIQRASHVSVLGVFFEALLEKYAAYTNDRVRSDVVAATTSSVPMVQADLGTSSAVLGWIFDSAEILDAYNKSIDSLIVSSDIFKQLAVATDLNNRPLLSINNDGQNTMGQVNVGALTGSIAGIPVTYDPGAAVGTAWFSNKSALTTYESPGAPLRLSDSNIKNLSNSFSVYGYMAVAVQRPELVVKSVFS